MPHPRAPPLRSVSVCCLSQNSTRDESCPMLKGQHTVPGVLPSLFSPNHERKV